MKVLAFIFILLRTISQVLLVTIRVMEVDVRRISDVQLLTLCVV